MQCCDARRESHVLFLLQRVRESKTADKQGPERHAQRLRRGGGWGKEESEANHRVMNSGTVSRQK